MSASPELLDRRLERAAAEHGSRVALVDVNGRDVTYAALFERACRVAAWLRARGVGREDRVALILPKDANAVACVFGVLRAGAAYLPIDAASPPERARTILADGAVAAVLVAPERLSLALELPTTPAVLSVPGPDWDALPVDADVAEPAGRDAEDLAYVLYTSGSTGIPKGVMLTHRNAGTFVDWAIEAFAPTPEDRASSHAPLHFDLSILDLYANLACGAAVHLIDEPTGKNPRALGELIEARRLTTWYSTPSVLSLIGAFGGLAGRDTRALRTVLFAGEVFPLKHLRKLTNLCQQAAFHNLYGPTETNVCTAARVPTPLAPERTTPVAIGHACAGYRGLVLDGPGGAPVAPGAEGLLHVCGPGLFRGYANAPELTAERVFERPASAGPGAPLERWYDTGDVVREDPDEGYRFIGRRDRMVKRRGHRVELAEVEVALHRHPRVRHAAVVALPDSDSGVVLRAHLVTEDGAPLSILELKTYCAGVLPASMVPDRFAFLPELPRTSTDKVDYQRLATDG